MLISLKKQFVFIAGLKTASTAIEECLKPFCEVSIAEPARLKHLPLRRVEEDFAWLRRDLPGFRPFVFGVVRDPLDYVVSLYNSHRKSAFRGRPHYSGDLSFEAFWRTWSEDRRFAWQFVPQTRRFLGQDGRLGVDYLVDYARLDAEWPAICDRIGVPAVPLARLNESPADLDRAGVPPEIAAAILERFAEDVATLREHTGRPLRAEATPAWWRAPDG
jgi:hypothetical protein